MRLFTILIFLFCLIGFQSCQSVSEFATQWSIDVKRKIVEDANQESDKAIFDSVRNNLTLYKAEKKLRSYHINLWLDSSGKLISSDTAVSIFYSADQDFELVRELCPVNDRSFEGIRYQGEHVGLAEFRYCDGKIKEAGFRFNGEVGIWKKYDTDGKAIEEIDKGNVERLENLKRIKYSR